MNKIKAFYNNHVDTEIRLIFAAVLFTFFLGLFLILLNTLFFHFTGLWYVPAIWVYISPAVFALILFALYFRDVSPRMTYFTRAYGSFFFICLALGFLTTGIQYTPFPLIDEFLVRIDLAMGFHSIAVLNWTYSHPTLHQILSFCYFSLGYELAAIPLILALLNDKNGFSLFLFGLIISYLIGTIIYYFFPSSGPTTIFYSPHFLAMQHDTYVKFYEVHHRMLLVTSAGGMIAFPSFHVIWSSLLTYACKNKWWLLIPVAIFNTIIVLSTFLLGWHYLTDVIGGFIVVAISLAIAHKILKNITTRT